MRHRCHHIVLASLIALPLTLNAASAGRHIELDPLDDITPRKSYGHDPIISKIEKQSEYAEIVSSLDKTLKPNQNVLISFNIDCCGDIKNLKVCSKKTPTKTEKKILALIQKCAPFRYPTTQEMIDRGVQVEFWKADRILSLARTTPGGPKQAEGQPPYDHNPFHTLYQDASR